MKYYKHLLRNTITGETKPASAKRDKVEPPWEYISVGCIREDPPGMCAGLKENLKPKP